MQSALGLPWSRVKLFQQFSSGPSGMKRMMMLNQSASLPTSLQLQIKSLMRSATPQHYPGYSKSSAKFWITRTTKHSKLKRCRPWNKSYAPGKVWQTSSSTMSSNQQFTTASITQTSASATLPFLSSKNSSKIPSSPCHKSKSLQCWKNLAHRLQILVKASGWHSNSKPWAMMYSKTSVTNWYNYAQIWPPNESLSIKYWS